MAEHLVCAELGRHGFYATPFSGNVPVYDVLVADDFGCALPIQVKATGNTGWHSTATLWMELAVDSQTGVQRYLGLKNLATPDLIYVCVVLAPLDSADGDRFFIMTEEDLQGVCVRHYKTDMDKRNWRRPKNPNSFHIKYYIEEIEEFENNWALISRRLQE
jgi:hypothetical protein